MLRSTVGSPVENSEGALRGKTERKEEAKERKRDERTERCWDVDVEMSATLERKTVPSRDLM